MSVSARSLRTRSLRPLAGTALAVVVSLSLAGCGGDDESGSDATSTSSAEASSSDAASSDVASSDAASSGAASGEASSDAPAADGGDSGAGASGKTVSTEEFCKASTQGAAAEALGTAAAKGDPAELAKAFQGLGGALSKAGVPSDMSATEKAGLATTIKLYTNATAKTVETLLDAGGDPKKLESLGLSAKDAENNLAFAQFVVTKCAGGIGDTAP